ncbi:MAG: hypothetical protein CFE45_27220, partial [Burkholderiales bacterium PBB5]
MTEDLDKDTALGRAQRLARKRQALMFVVWTCSGYAAASEDDLDTWWQGATAVAEVHEDGVCV